MVFFTSKSASATTYAKYTDVSDLVQKTWGTAHVKVKHDAPEISSQSYLS